MVSDLLACQYILKSQHFTVSPTFEAILHLVVGDGNLLGIKGQA
jgi:hypothetical protein